MKQVITVPLEGVFEKAILAFSLAKKIHALADAEADETWNRRTTSLTSSSAADGDGLADSEDDSLALSLALADAEALALALTDSEADALADGERLALP